MFSLGAPSTFIPSTTFLTIILSSIIKLSAESTSPSSVNQNSFGEGIKQINSTDWPSPVSEEERLQYLGELQAETTIIMLPALILIIVLVLTGLIGNSLVIFVYSLKFKPSATRIIIISIASLDLVANVLGLPGDIYVLRHMWNFDNQDLCRVTLFLAAFPTISSALVLLAIVIIRYRKICAPHGWQITTGNAKVISIVVPFLGVLFSIPATIMHGRQTVVTPRTDITGYTCATNDSYKKTVWPLLSYSFFFTMYACSSVLLTVLYILIGRQAWKHRTRRSGPLPPEGAVKIQVAYNSSSGIVQSQSDEFQLVKPLGSTEILDLSCTSNENLQDTQSQHIDQYVVRVVDDRVEIRSPRMREIVASLQKVMSERAGVPGNRVEDVLMTHAGNVKDIKHPVLGSNMATQHHVTYSDVSMYDNNKCLSSTKAVLDDRLNTRCRAETTPTRDPSFYTRKQTERRTPHPSFCTHERTDKETLTTISETDQIAAFNWLDIVYCPEGGHATTNPDAPKTGNSFTFRISPSNNLLEKADWLRNIIVEAVAKSTPRSTRSGEVGGLTELENVELRVLENRNEKRETPGDDISCMDGTTQTSSTETETNRKRPLLKVSSKQSEPKRQISSRTTVMLFLISAVYVLGYLPHLALKFFELIETEKFESLRGAALGLHAFFVRTHFTNSAANAIIYSLCDRNFRKECFRLFSCISRQWKS